MCQSLFLKWQIQNGVFIVSFAKHGKLPYSIIAAVYYGTKCPFANRGVPSGQKHRRSSDLARLKHRMSMAGKERGDQTKVECKIAKEGRESNTEQRGW